MAYQGKKYDEDETISITIHDCLFMLADMNKRNPMYVDTTEGLHRGIAMAHVNTESKINAFTAQLN